MLRFLVLFFVLFLLTSCGDTVVYESSSESDAQLNAGGNLFVHAIDAVSGNPISGAEFFLLAVDNEPRKSNGINGTTYRNLPIGENYAISVSAGGYSSVVCDASIKLADNQNNLSTPIVESTTLAVPLRKLSASLRGSIFYQDLSVPLQLELHPASGAKVSLIIQDDGNCSLEQRILT
ncbi:MAG: hypothetical protein FWH22_01680 [Fibromonadales bacterium]|nr:hypothetical protein [Fibromonadales bacterium]